LDDWLAQLAQIINITVNLAFIHRRPQVISDHRDRRAITQAVLILIRNSKETRNQCPFVQSPQPGEVGQFISAHSKGHLGGDRAVAGD
jgi:hypothetical protein